jgi:hypothetical protein
MKKNPCEGIAPAAAVLEGQGDFHRTADVCDVSQGIGFKSQRLW